MASWWSSLDAVLRLQGILVWATVVLALLAAACGIFSHFLSHKASSMRAQLEGAQLQEARQLAESSLEEVEEGRRKLRESEGRELRLVQEMESLAQQLARSREEAQSAQERGESARRQAAQAGALADRLRGERAQLLEAQDAEAAMTITPRKKEKLLRALEGKLPGPLTIVAVSGSQVSKKLASELEAVLREAGWTPDMREGRFQEPPRNLYFIIHSQETIPDYTAGLAVGLAVIDLMSVPAKVHLNDTKPAGTLELVIGVGDQ